VIVLASQWARFVSTLFTVISLLGLGVSFTSFGWSTNAAGTLAFILCACGFVFHLLALALTEIEGRLRELEQASGLRKS
jgi:Na+/citrate or Na+/malate symporter